MKTDLAPIALFVYNRPNQTLETLESLMSNDLAQESDLYIFSDGPKKNASLEQLKKIENTRKIIRDKKWCKTVTIIESEENKGLAQSIITGVSKIVSEHGKIIVLEDDIVTSRYFLKYMNESLVKYLTEEKVFQISGFNFPIKELKNSSDCFFIPLISSWSWATWDRAWIKFDPLANGYEELKSNEQLRNRFNLDSSYSYSDMLISQMENKNIDSWAIRWLWTIFKNEKLTLFPPISFVKNIGYGVDATHTKVKLNYIKTNSISNDFKNFTFPKTIECNEKKWTLIKKFIAKNYLPEENYWLKRKFISLYNNIKLNLVKKQN